MMKGLTKLKKTATVPVMEQALQRQAVQVFREHSVGFFTPDMLLAKLRLFLRGLGPKQDLRRKEDLLNLTDEQAQLVIKYLPRMQTPLLAPSMTARALK